MSIIILCFIFFISINPINSNLLFPPLKAFNHNPLVNQITKMYNEISDEIKIRRYNIIQFKDQLTDKVNKSYLTFTKSQTKTSTNTINDINKYIRKFNIIYNETKTSLQKQLNIIQELDLINNNREPIYESLEKFKKFYDQNIINTTTTLSTTLSKNILNSKIINDFEIKKSFNNTINDIFKSLQNEWTGITQQITYNNIQYLQSLLTDFNNIQTDIIYKAGLFYNQSQNNIITSTNMSKKQLLIEKYVLDSKFQQLDETLNKWYVSRRSICMTV